MINFILRRVVTSLVLMIIISVVTFGVFFMVPKLAGTNPAELYVGKSATPADVAATGRKLGLDQPIYVQYGRFVKGIVAGRDFDSGPDKTHCAAPCFGYSFRNDRPVWPLLLDRLPVTISLAIGAAIIWLVGGVLAGVISALRRGSILDRTTMIVALAGVSLPIYFTGLVAQLVFVHNLHWFKGGEYVNFADDPIGWANKLFLGWVTLALLYAATYARLTRAQMLETVGEDYIRTARAKGQTERKVLVRHALANAAVPIVTVIGLGVAALIGGVVVTESVYTIPGLGRLTVDAVLARDYPTIQAVILLFSLAYVLINLAVDMTYTYFDPRIRY
jgi:peptide/nickel transport system permease protein